ncbi:protein SON isoform X3 [Larimichthys crocea]|uniref:protein SON isoform X3 n=1 Tax=Larimichthys crocea TaxID=215358 RepID=UPI000F5FB0BF|nr:protein SON isoform X3 [Larimichthys crocea]
MNQSEDREEGVPPSKSTLCGEHDSQTKAQSPQQTLRPDSAGPEPGPGPEPSCVSIKNDGSIGRFIEFKVVRPSAAQRRKLEEPQPRTVSMKSDESMGQPISFKDGRQSVDQSAGEGVGAANEVVGVEETTSKRDKQEDLQGSGSQKKHKKHKKHKSKKKRRNREKDKESSSESGTELDRGTNHQPRRGTSKEANMEQGVDNESNSRCHKRNLTGKRKKKKKRRKGEENSSDSDSEFMSKQRDSKCGQSLSPRRREELPDIIPKQDSSNKRRGDKECHGRRSCRSCSQLHSYSYSHSCSVGRNSHAWSKNHHRRSRTRSLSSTQRPRTRSSSSEKRRALDEPIQSTQGPFKGLQSSQQASSPVRSNIKPEELTESSIELQSPEQSEKPSEKKDEKAEDTTQKLGSGSSHFVLNQSISAEPDQSTEPSFPQLKGAEYPRSFSTNVKLPAKKKRKPSKSPLRKKEGKSSKRQKQSMSPCRSHRRGSRSRSLSKRKRSRSRSGGRRSRRSHSRSVSRGRRRATYNQRDRWKREPSHSPVLILRKNRSPIRKHCSSSNSPQRISELDKDQLLEIAKANAAAMCAKAGMPIPANMRSAVLPLALPMAMNAAMASMTAATMTAALSNIGTLSSLLPLPSITNKPPPVPAQHNILALEEVKRKVVKQANSISIKEFTDVRKCKMIVDSKGELPVAVPHVSDEEDDGKPFGGSALREQKVISFSINNTTVRPTVRSDAGMAKEFPVSSGSQHRKKEGEALGVYGEWVPVDKTTDKAAAISRKALTTVPITTATSSSGETTAAGLPQIVKQPAFVPDDSVFPDPLLQVDAWAQSSTVPGLFTGSTGAQVLSSEELSTGGPQAWLKKDQFLRAAPVSGGVGEFLMRKMGWKTGEGLGRNREGTVEPIIIDFKVDRKGLVAEGEKPQKQTGGLVVTKDLMGKHPVSALIELCNKRRIMQPDFVMVHHSGPDHRKNFLFKVTVNGVDYQPQTASPNKKHAKAMAATVALQALGEVPVDGPGLYTGPVFTAASTGPLFST